MMQKRSLSSLLFVVCALILTGLFTTAHLAGFREYTSVWAGTHSGEPWTLAAGGVYLMLYLLWVVVAPICLLSGVMLWFAERVFGTRAKMKSSER